ncbi:hypothetical protein CN685_18370 [Bacillus wiedmannii]|nr:hypothetical protein CN685_18370 [Bacillus wiedmannii]
MFLTLYLVSAYINRNILYNEGVKSNEVANMNIKKENLANSIEIERGGGKVWKNQMLIHGLLSLVQS